MFLRGAEGEYRVSAKASYPTPEQTRKETALRSPFFRTEAWVGAACAFAEICVQWACQENLPGESAMPKEKWNLNTIYISERLQESLRPISRCALTTVVAPMGYGKTTAVSWYLEGRGRTEAPRILRISVYSDNLMIFWKSVQEAFARVGFGFLRDYACPVDAAGGARGRRPLPRAGGGDTLLYIH